MLPARGPLSARSIARRRLASQRLPGPPQEDPAAVVRRLGAMQSQDFLEAQWAIGQRLHGWGEEEVHAAFQRGELLRTHVLRPTWHFVVPGDLRWMQALTVARVHARNRTVYAEVGIDPATAERATRVICAALEADRRPLTRAELGDALGAAGIEASGSRLAHLVMYAELESAICNGPMRGRRHTYLPFDAVVPAGAQPSRDQALAELARRYFLSHGPATLGDFAWWSGLTLSDCRDGVAAIAGELREEHGPDGTAWYSDPALRDPPPRTQAMLAANVDELIVAHQDLKAALPRPGVLDPPFDRLVLVDGLAVGRWRRDLTARAVRVEVRLVERLGARRTAMLEAEVRRFGRFLGREPELIVEMIR